jgi:histidinol-phosphatase (PHP family)
MVDLHIHTGFSDGLSDHEEYLEKAIELEYEYIGFSDHLCLEPVSWAMPLKDLFLLEQKMEQLKTKYADKITVLFGLEVDYFPDKEDTIRRILSRLPLDYVIGAVHFIQNWNFEFAPEDTPEWALEEMYQFYFSLVEKAACSGLFDIIGHFDLVKKYGPEPGFNTRDIYLKALKKIRSSGCILEVNTSGLNKLCMEFYPSRSILEWAYELNVPITISSDSHQTLELGQHYPLALQQLMDLGYREVHAFKNRVVFTIPISRMISRDIQLMQRMGS